VLPVAGAKLGDHGTVAAGAIIFGRLAVTCALPPVNKLCAESGG
jgi:hypothetical protein